MFKKLYHPLNENYAHFHIFNFSFTDFVQIEGLNNFRYDRCTHYWRRISGACE